jgi:hypothetical protein
VVLDRTRWSCGVVRIVEWLDAECEIFRRGLVWMTALFFWGFDGSIEKGFLTSRTPLLEEEGS